MCKVFIYTLRHQNPSKNSMIQALVYYIDDNTPILWISPLLLVQSPPKAFRLTVIPKLFLMEP